MVEVKVRVDDNPNVIDAGAEHGAMLLTASEFNRSTPRR